jgi:peroxiredoxin
MSRTKSTMMLQLGAQAPEFSLPDAHGRLVSRSDYVGKPLLVAFICNACPYVLQIRSALSHFAKDYIPQGLAIVAINANDAVASPEDTPEAMIKAAEAAGYPFAYLVDASQKIALAYRAACTPDFFLFDNNHKLVYRGQFDSARPGNDMPVDGADLRQATHAVLARLPPLEHQRPSMGCNIKWREDAAPAYFQRQ